MCRRDSGLSHIAEMIRFFFVHPLNFWCVRWAFNCHSYLRNFATLLLTELGYEFCPDSTPGIFKHIWGHKWKDIGSMVDGLHLRLINWPFQLVAGRALSTRARAMCGHVSFLSFSLSISDVWDEHSTANPIFEIYMAQKLYFLRNQVVDSGLVQHLPLSNIKYMWGHKWKDIGSVVDGPHLQHIREFEWLFAWESVRLGPEP